MYSWLKCQDLSIGFEYRYSCWRRYRVYTYFEKGDSACIDDFKLEVPECYWPMLQGPSGPTLGAPIQIICNCPEEDFSLIYNGKIPLWTVCSQFHDIYPNDGAHSLSTFC